MDTREFPTKGNLIANKNTLALAKMGYELMDKKRNVLVSEIVGIVDQIREINAEINGTFADAYAALEQANVQLGIMTVRDMAAAVPVCDDVKIYTRNVMDSEIPMAEYKASDITPAYPFFKTNESLDIARMRFSKVRELVVKMAVLENAAFRLSTNINKAQKRANALKNITIPRYEELVKNISASLEEKEREEFTRLKVIKKNKQKTNEE
ncbi:MAG: V-type ATP synthase subunit D [Lachnospiraceae bacterium]|nr:V-type ATP synthase subunit D [Lachnospiraceae bacterium]